MREREYRNRVLLYLNDCEEEERKILACQLYFSMNDFSSPLPSSSVLAPFEFSVLRELGYHFHFIASVAYKKRERKKEMAWPRSYQNFKDQFMGWRGSVEWAWAPHMGPFRGTPHIGTFQQLPTHIDPRDRRTCFSSTSSSGACGPFSRPRAFGRRQLLFCCRRLLFSLVRHSK